MSSSLQISDLRGIKWTFLESTWQELPQNTTFTYFGQVFQKVRQYKCNLTTFWHGLLPNMAISGDSGWKFVISYSSDLRHGSRILFLEISILPSFRNASVFLDQVWWKYWSREVKSFWFKISQFWYIFVSAHALKRWYVQEEMASWSFDLLYGFITVKYYWSSDLSIFNWIEFDYCNLW